MIEDLNSRGCFERNKTEHVRLEPYNDTDKTITNSSQAEGKLTHLLIECKAVASLPMSDFV